MKTENKTVQVTITYPAAIAANVDDPDSIFPFIRAAARECSGHVDVCHRRSGKIEIAYAIGSDEQAFRFVKKVARGFWLAEGAELQAMEQANLAGAIAEITLTEGCRTEVKVGAGR